MNNDNNTYDYDTDESSSRFSYINKEGWIALTIGLVLAIVVFCYSPLGKFITHYFKTLVHEIGHTLFAALFGCPSIPAFDFQYGGGFAPIKEQKTWLLVVDYLGIFAAFCYFYKRWKAVLVLIIFTVIYSILAFTESYKVIYIFMGHGFELVIAAIFLYRALTGSAVVNALERPLYAFIAFFIILTDTKFAYLLLTDKTERILYGFGKGGHSHDFVAIAKDYLNCDLRAVAAFFLACCILTPILTFIFYFFRGYFFYAINWIFGEPEKTSDHF